MARGWTKLLETVYGPFEQKKRYRQYKARVQRLPAGYRTAVDALQRYSYYFGHGTTEGGLSMLEDLVDLFEQSAASGTPICCGYRSTPMRELRLVFCISTRRLLPPPHQTVIRLGRDTRLRNGNSAEKTVP